MYRLLIVDNERMIVDGLVELFMNCAEWDLEVYGAYSVTEALSWLGRAKIDVVLSDVRMPIMSGLDLQKEIIAQWPRCKVIFLSGYNDFSYIQEAVRHGSVDYLLKTEDNSTIVEAVGRALAKLTEEKKTDEWIREARQQLLTAMPVLQKEYLSDLLQGDPYALRQRSTRFADLQIPLDSEEPLLIMVGRIDEWKPESSSYDQSLYRYALQNIAAEYLHPRVRFACVEVDRSSLLWLMQPHDPQTAMREDGERWSRAIRFVHGTMEQIQASFRQYFHLYVSLAADSQPVPWPDASVRYEHVRRQLGRSAGTGAGRLIVAPSAASSAQETCSVEMYGKLKTALKRAELLVEHLEHGQEAECLQEVEEIMSTDFNGVPNEAHMRMQLYYTLASAFLNYLYRSGLYDALGGEIELYKLPDPGSPWEPYTAYYKQIVRLIFERQRQGSARREHEVIRQVNKYIEDNLHEDLSLVRIGEVVGLNSFYLSRLYKKMSGKGIKEQITQVRLLRAKELLRQQDGKIGDIAMALGFLTETYFYRFFRKMMNMTPQEYRDSFK